MLLGYIVERFFNHGEGGGKDIWNIIFNANRKSRHLNNLKMISDIFFFFSGQLKYCFNLFAIKFILNRLIPL